MELKNNITVLDHSKELRMEMCGSNKGMQELEMREI
jgi:hypothetical protein